MDDRNNLLQRLSIRWLCIIVFIGGLATPARGRDDAGPTLPDFRPAIDPLLVRYCADCHADGAEEGGFDLDRLGSNLSDARTFARWEQIFDRVRTGEMPPKDAEPMGTVELQLFKRMLSEPLSRAHSAEKSTVLRRLNRREYQNTLNDLFGTNLNLQRMLPEDARSHEFDNIGESLGLSMVHLQRYMDAARIVLDDAIEQSTEPPEPSVLKAWYKDTREAEKHVGKAWKLLDDGYVVRFEGGGYPTGMMRGTGVKKAGRYRVQVTGYAYHSDDPVVFSIGGTSFAPGSEKPIYGFYEFNKGSPQTIQFETWIEPKYMIAIEPYGISDPGRYKRKSAEQYDGPGLAIGEVIVEGPLVDQFPSRGHQLIFGDARRTEIPPRNPRDRKKSWYRPKFQIETDDEVDFAKRSLQRIGTSLFRRPAGDDQVSSYVQLFRQQRDDGDSIEDALKTAVTALMCSPRFLFLDEPQGRLDSYATAARLSYFLNRTAPDSTLLNLASQNQLTNSGQLIQQADRLMRGEHFSRFIDDFTDSWLDLREIDFTAPDKKLFPEFDDYLRYSMPRETRAYVREMIESNRPIDELVQSDFAMLNDRLADHYDLPPVGGTAIRKVSLPNDSIRGGLLSQASILKVTANGTNTSPVTRGIWVMERIEGITPSPPPPGIPGVEPDIRGATSLRELLDKHRDSTSCNACHSKIDPPGFALECFNPIGGFRDRYRSLGSGERAGETVRGRRVGYRWGPEVDDSGQFDDGTRFADFIQFRNHLASDRAGLARAFMVKLLTFATGREMGFSDRPEINRLVQSAAGDGYRTRDLFYAAITSEIFRTK